MKLKNENEFNKEMNNGWILTNKQIDFISRWVFSGVLLFEKMILGDASKKFLLDDDHFDNLRSFLWLTIDLRD